MQLSLFDQVDDLLHALVPDELGRLESRTHRRGVKVWFDSDDAPREHYEAQLLARRHVDGTEGMALEIGWHAEYKGILRDDIELLQTFRKGFDLGCCLLASFIHLLQDIIIPCFCTKEDHTAACFAHQCQIFIGVFIKGIDTTFSPPLHVLVFHQF